jgi:hypothetical protein
VLFWVQEGKPFQIIVKLAMACIWLKQVQMKTKFYKQEYNYQIYTNLQKYFTNAI